MMLSLKIRLPEANSTKTVQLNSNLLVYDACKLIRERFQEFANQLGKASDYGLFLNDEDPRKGRWLDPNRTLEFYLLRNGDTLEYRKKIRSLKVRMLDNSVKTLMVDESQTLKNLLPIICAKIGLTNYDEYDLVREIRDEEKENARRFSESGSTTGTLKKSGTLTRDRDQKKMDKLKQKLATDDDVSWVDQSRTLIQQGVDDSDVLLLKRRYFYSDQNVDARDPVQLNLLYVQCRDAILSGTHPVTVDQAQQFAGIQAQAEYGDYDESRRVIDMRPFMPKSYEKAKGNSADRRVFDEWNKQRGSNDLMAKVAYIKLARSLKTYGVTFFLVREKLKGKNKLVPCLFGVTRNSVLRLDQQTKETLTTWPLTQVKRWAASPNTFTLDFGDYADNYYSVETKEGEQIAQLIAGYIDIILKRQKPKDHFGVDGEEGCTLEEDEVLPAKISVIQPRQTKVDQPVKQNIALPGIMRDINAEKPVKAIEAAKTKLVKIVENLQKPAVLPPIGEDPVSKKWVEQKLEVSKQSVGTQMAQITRHVAQIVNLTAPPTQERDFVAIDRAVNTIADNLDEMVDSVKFIAAVLEDGNKGDELYDATQKLIRAVRDLLDAAKPGEAPRQEVLTAATKVGEASKEIMDHVDPLSVEYQDSLVILAKAVANSTAHLVRKAKEVAAATDNFELQNRIIQAATQTALSTSELVACAKVLLPTITSPPCQDQLVDAARKVAKSVQDLLDACKISGVEKHLLEDLNDAAAQVTRALNDLLGMVKQGPEITQAPVPHEAAVEVITQSTTHLCEAPEPAEMIRQAKVLAQATAELVKGLKSEAEAVTDKDLQRRLLAASKQLADATTRLVEAAKLCAAVPQDQDRRQAMRDAAVNIRDLAQQATVEDEKAYYLKRLETSAKRMAQASTQTIAASQAAEATNLNRGSQQNLLEQCRIVADRLSRLISAIKVTSSNPQDQMAITQLLQNSEDVLSPAEELVSAAKAAVPTVQDSSAAHRLRESATNLGMANGELRTSLNKAKDFHTVTAEVNVDTAMTVIYSLEQDLDAFKRAAQNGSLMPLPDETASSAASRLQASAKQVSSATVQLLNATNQADENYVADASQNVARSLQDLSAAARGVAATTPDDRQSQLRMLDSVQEVVERSAYLVDSVRNAFGKSTDPVVQSSLVDAARQVAAALNRCLNFLPDQRGITKAMKTVEETSQRIVSHETVVRPSRTLVADVFIDLNNAGAVLNEAAGDVVTSTYGSMEQLGSSAEHYSEVYRQFVDSGMHLISTETDTYRREEMRKGLEDVSSASKRLLALAKQTNGQPDASHMKNQLTAAARAVTESINNLLTYSAQSLPGQKECDNSIRRIQQLRTSLDNCSVPANSRTYYESLDAVLDSSRVLGEGMAGISNAAKYNQTDQFIQAVRSTTEAVSALIENSAQAAYLIGISDPSSVVGKSGVIDQREISDAIRGIHDASRAITASSPVTQQQMLAAATVIAKYSHTLCSSCRTASNRTPNPVAKRQFVQSAKDIATSTANLVRAVKTLDGSFTETNRQECVTHINQLLRSVDDLGAFSNSPEFASSAGQLSSGGRKAQEPIVVSGKCIIDATSSLILAAKSLSVNPGDPSAWQALTSQSNNVSDSVKSLATAIRDKAPGQTECSEAIERLNNYLRIVNRASLAATNQSLPQRNENTTEGFYEITINTSVQLSQTILSVREAAKSEAEGLGHGVSRMSNYFQSLVQDGIGAASRAPSANDQMTVLTQLKTVLEASIQFIEVCKACGGNPRTRNLHGDVNESADSLLEALHEFTQTLERIQSQAGFVRTMIDNVSAAISKVDHRISASEDSFVDFQTRMFRYAKEMSRITHEISAKSQSEPHELGNLAQQLYSHYNLLAEDARGAQSASASNEIGQRIRSSVQDLGHSVIDLIKTAGSVQSNPSDTYIKDELTRSSKLVIEKVTHVLSALQSGSRGTQACINAASTVSGVIGDLDTTIMFATAGILQAEDESDRFSDHREDILKTAKALVEDTKTLVTGAASSQEQLAVAAQNAVKTIIQLAEVVKSGAASLGKENSESQRPSQSQTHSLSLITLNLIAKRLEMERSGQKVLLINAVRDVASALGDLIHATKSASGKSLNDPAMLYLKDSAKIMVTNVTSLLKTVKTVEDEHARGTRALEATIEALSQELRVFDTSDGSSDGRTATAEDLLRVTKPLTQATYKAVTAGKTLKQEDAITAANMGRKAVGDLLYTCRAAANSCESPETRHKVLSAGREAAIKYRELLSTVHMILTKPEARHMQNNLVQMTQSIASAVALIAAAAESMKDSDTWVNPEDPTVIAENELLGAAATIEHAARKLSQLQPRRIEYKVENEMLNFDKLILDACQQITTATAALIKSTCAAQAELVGEGRVSARPLYSSEDGQWSDGLIMAARTVAAACHNLCEAANALVQGHATEEKLIASAKQVASSTAQLLVACRVKSDSNSPSLQRLQAAGNAVMRATDALVRAAQQSQDAYEERSLVINRRIVGGIAQEINAQEEVLIKERELEEAKGKLTALRKAKYGERQSDDEYYGYGASSSGHTTYHSQSETRITEARYTSGYTSQ